jgi:hypothetical protein
LKHNVWSELVFGLVLSLAVAGAWAGETDWMTDEGGVLDIKVALADKGAACGGALMIDRNKKMLVFEGAPGEIGCKLKLEEPFAEVKSVKTGDGAGFLLELKKGKQKKLLMIPVVHVQWLIAQPMVGGGFGQAAQSANLVGPDGEPMRVGGAAGGVGPSVKKVEIPKEVAADTEKVARTIREALGQN